MKGMNIKGIEISETDESITKHKAGLVSSGQKVKQFEIASYRRLRLFAELIGLSNAASLPEVNTYDN